MDAAKLIVGAVHPLALLWLWAWCGTVSVGKWLPHFKDSLLGVLDSSQDDRTFLENVGHYNSSDTTSHPRRTESSYKYI
jgi:hypothetical protein